MGEVYRARDTRLKRDVALKVLPASFEPTPDRLARFRREAEVLASLNDPHIAQVYGLEESNGTLVLVMELVGGQALSDRIARGASGRPEIYVTPFAQPGGEATGRGAKWQVSASGGPRRPALAAHVASGGTGLKVGGRAAALHVQRAADGLNAPGNESIQVVFNWTPVPAR